MWRPSFILLSATGSDHLIAKAKSLQPEEKFCREGMAGFLSRHPQFSTDNSDGHIGTCLQRTILHSRNDRCSTFCPP